MQLCRSGPTRPTCRTVRESVLARASSGVSPLWALSPRRPHFQPLCSLLLRPHIWETLYKTRYCERLEIKKKRNKKITLDEISVKRSFLCRVATLSAAWSHEAQRLPIRLSYGCMVLSKLAYQSAVQEMFACLFIENTRPCANGTMICGGKERAKVRLFWIFLNITIPGPVIPLPWLITALYLSLPPN